MAAGGERLVSDTESSLRECHQPCSHIRLFFSFEYFDSFDHFVAFWFLLNACIKRPVSSKPHYLDLLFNHFVMRDLVRGVHAGLKSLKKVLN